MLSFRLRFRSAAEIAFEAKNSGQVEMRPLISGYWVRLAGAILLACGTLPPDAALAQDAAEDASKQIWANLILSRPKSEKLYLEYDIEGARQVSGGEPWSYLYGTGLVEYYPNGFIDLTGELSTGFTRQTSEENSFEATVRLGARLHLITQIFNSPFIEEIRPERMSGKKFSIANLARFEFRNFWYSGDRPSSSDIRFRNRIEFKLALNESSLAEDGVWYLIADTEWFVPMNDEDQAAERFATKRRIRAGIGFRQSYEWRFEFLAMRDTVRDTLEGDIELDANILDLRVKWFF